MFKSSGLINGGASLFVVPAAMPVQVDAIPVNFGERQRGWGEIAIAMVSDLNDELVIDDIRENGDNAGCDRETERAIRGDEINPYRWADKDVAWQNGVS